MLGRHHTSGSEGDASSPRFVVRTLPGVALDGLDPVVDTLQRWIIEWKFEQSRRRILERLGVDAVMVFLGYGLGQRITRR